METTSSIAHRVFESMRETLVDAESKLATAIRFAEETKKRSLRRVIESHILLAEVGSLAEVFIGTTLEAWMRENDYYPAKAFSEGSPAPQKIRKAAVFGFNLAEDNFHKAVKCCETLKLYESRDLCHRISDAVRYGLAAGINPEWVKARFDFAKKVLDDSGFPSLEMISMEI